MSARLSQTANQAPASVVRHNNDLVLAAVPLKPGFDRSQLSRFADDQWNLSPAIFRENARRFLMKLDFSIITDPRQRLIGKEFMYAKLHERLPGIKKNLAPTSARAVLSRFIRFTTFVERRTGDFVLADVRQELLDDYLTHLRRGNRRAPPQVSHVLDIVFDLYRYGTFLSDGGLTFVPWKGRSSSEVAGCAYNQENSTRRIPEPIISALLRWSLLYVDHFAPDIQAARAEIDALTARYETIRVDQIKSSTPIARILHDRVAAWISNRRAAGRGIPIWQDFHNNASRIDETTGAKTPPVNYQLIRLHVGADHPIRISTPGSTRRLIDAAIDELGIEVGGMDTNISHLPDSDKPWRPPFDTKSLAEEEKMLQVACYIICAYLSGMRDSEVQAMRTDCLRTVRSADGLVDRYLIRSRSYKNRGMAGQAEDWITIEPVARAIKVLQQLAKSTQSRRGLDTLWLVLKNHKSTKDHLSTDIVRSLNEFRAHLDVRHGSPGKPAVPLGPDGNPWQITTRQFRRTVAWYIANRPFGTVAGMIQYKHVSIAMFEGYAGSAGSGFRREVEQEHALGQLDDIIEHYENFKRGMRPTGPASARIIGEFEQVRQKLDDFPGRVTDQGRLHAMLKHLARTLHVGFLNDCFFEPTTALCLQRSKSSEKSRPILSRCSPDRCPNSCISRRHLAPWEASIAEAERLLKTQRLSSLQKQALTEDNERKQRLIEPVKRGPP